MKSAISKLNQSGLHLDDEAVRTIQAASRPDWNPHEQLVLVTIPDVSSQPVAVPQRSAPLTSTVRADLPNSAQMFSSIASMIGEVKPDSSVPAKPATLDQVQGVAPAETILETSVPLSPVIESAAEQPPVKATVGNAPNSDQSTSGGRVTHSAIVESLVARFAAESSCLIHFCDTDQPRRSAEVCLSIGMEYAEKTRRRVLLLDTSHLSRPLSSLLGVDLAAGFREVLRTELNWRHLVRQTSHPLVEVLPAGVIKLGTTATRSDFEFQMRKLIVELSAHYGGVFSCADSAFDLESELIGLCSKGGFLTMDFHRSSRGLAKSAANQMRTSGTRLLGCIAVAGK